jgi:hypothetical protein
MMCICNGNGKKSQLEKRKITQSNHELCDILTSQSFTFPIHMFCNACDQNNIHSAILKWSMHSWGLDLTNFHGCCLGLSGCCLGLRNQTNHVILWRAKGEEYVNLKFKIGLIK